MYKALECAKINNHRQLVCMTVKEIESLKYRDLAGQLQDLPPHLQALIKVYISWYHYVARIRGSDFEPVTCNCWDCFEDYRTGPHYDPNAKIHYWNRPKPHTREMEMWAKASTPDRREHGTLSK